MSKKDRNKAVSKPFQPIAFALLPSETILPDDYPLHTMYVYIIDNVFRRWTFEPMTVKQAKQTGIKEIRRCDLFGHKDARLGDICK